MTDTTGKINFANTNAQNLFKLTKKDILNRYIDGCLLYTSPSPRDRTRYRMPSSA